MTVQDIRLTLGLEGNCIVQEFLITRDYNRKFPYQAWLLTESGTWEDANTRISCSELGTVLDFISQYEAKQRLIPRCPPQN